MPEVPSQPDLKPGFLEYEKICPAMITALRYSYNYSFVLVSEQWEVFLSFKISSVFSVPNGWQGDNLQF